MGALNSCPNELVLVCQLLKLLRFQPDVRQCKVRVAVVRAKGRRLRIKQ